MAKTPIPVKPEPSRTRGQKFGIAVFSLAALTGLFAVGFSLVYAGKAFPGVSVDGAYVGGLGRDAAIQTANDQLKDYRVAILTINYGSSTLRIPTEQINLKYDAGRAVDAALTFGRRGSLLSQLLQRLRSVMGRPSTFASFTYDDAKLTPYLAQITDDVTQPAVNASLKFLDDGAHVVPGQTGRRLDIGQLTLLINERLSQASDDPITAPVYDLAPQVDGAGLDQAKHQADAYLQGPVTLKGQGFEKTIDPGTIISWLNVRGHQRSTVANPFDLTRFYDAGGVTVELDQTKITAYVAALAQSVDQSAQNAQLTIQDDKATVFKPSRTGTKLDQAGAVVAINAALTQPLGQRQAAVNLQPLKPDVSEESLNNLGIKELIGEGVTYFPGSAAARINNIRLGAALYNGVLVKPGETFSFNQYFINVDAEHGWAPGLSIVGDKIEPIFGGGICQVSSTAYRAALLAGLPIVQRTSHAYAVGFYTSPFGVPGVDATVYNPGVDFQFRNDTGSYILIQTVIQGTTLKFDFYGTKTKSARIRGPFFIDGSNDVTKPSTTIFYRDILDLAGNVTASDPVTTHYKSSLDFTHVDTP